MNMRRSTFAKYFIGAVLGAALYSEWAVFRVQPVYWPELRCEDEKSCTKILFIADPQIQGDMAVPPPLSYLYNWDSDRFVKSTFSVVMNHFKPDVLVYLGDLMDEGSIATMPQFHHYAKRLFDIFETKDPVVQIWLPGDNDIGGENESVKKDKVAEFQKIFNQPAAVAFRNITFYKVNMITNTIPDLIDDDNYRIVVSHYPVTSRPMYGERVNYEIHPHIYFCAHSHEAKYTRMDQQLHNRETYWFTHQILSVPPDGPAMYEVSVPTCSYRMGTAHIGYGAAVMDDKFNLNYTVFWSPQRFPYLFLYLVILLIVLLYCIVFCTAKLLYRQKSSIGSSADNVPLLGKV